MPKRNKIVNLSIFLLLFTLFSVSFYYSYNIIPQNNKRLNSLRNDLDINPIPSEINNNVLSSNQIICLEISHNRIFILDKNHGIFIYDILPTNNFIILGHYNESILQDVLSIKVFGNTLYLLQNSSFLIFKVQSSGSLSLISKTVINNGKNGIHDFIIYGNLMYISYEDNQEGYLKIFNLSNIENPDVVLNVQLTFIPNLLDISDNNLFLISKNGRFGALSLQNPLQSLYFYNNYDYEFIGSKIDDYQLYLLHKSGWLTLDSINSDRITLISEINLSTDVQFSHLVLYSHYLYIEDRSSILAYDITNRIEPNLIGNYTLNGNILTSKKYGGNLFLIDDVDGLSILPISSALIPPQKMVDFNDINSITQKISIKNNYLFTASLNGFYSYEIIDCTKGNYQLIDFYGWGLDNDGINVRALEIYGNIAYIFLENSTLLVFNISNPASIELISQYVDYWIENIQNIEFYGNYALISAEKYGIISLDVSDSNNVHLINSYNTTINFASDFDIAGKVLYLVDKDENLQIFDISDPSNPILLKTKQMKNIVGINLKAHLAVIVKGKNGLTLYDISNLDDIIEINSYNRGFINFVNAFIDGYNIYVLDDNRESFYGDLDQISHRLFSFYIFDFSTPETIGYCSFFHSVSDMELMYDKIYLSHHDGGFYCVKVQQTGLDDFDGDNLPYIDEKWIHNTDPNKYNFLHTQSYFVVVGIFAVAGVLCIIWAKRNYDKRSKQDPFARKA